VAKDILGWFPRQRGADSQRHGLLHAAPAGYVQRISAPRTRNGSRSGRISRNYLRFVYSVANVATVARVSGLRAFLRFTPEAGYNGYIGYKPVDQDVLGRTPPPMRRRQPRQRHIARHLGAPCKPATDKGSMRREHVRSPVLAAPAQIIDLMCNL